MNASDAIGIQGYQQTFSSPLLPNGWTLKPIGPFLQSNKICTIFQRVSEDIKKESIRWLGTVIPLSQNSQGCNSGAIQVKLKADLFAFWSQGQFKVPKNFLANLGILDPFTQYNTKAKSIHESGTENTLRFVIRHDRFVSFASAEVRDGQTYVPLLEYIQTHRRPPQSIKSPNGGDVPLHGLMSLLAVARALGEADVMGAGARKAGFTWETNSRNEIVAARTAKIEFDPHWFTYDFDHKDIALFKEHLDAVISWECLEEEQKKEFMATLEQLIHSAEKSLLHEWIRLSTPPDAHSAVDSKFVHRLLKRLSKERSIYEISFDSRAVLQSAFATLSIPGFQTPIPLESIYFPPQITERYSFSEMEMDRTVLYEPYEEEQPRNAFEPITERTVPVLKFLQASCWEKGNVILIQGDPGSGKSSLCQYLAYKWASETLESDFDTVFFIPLRQCNHLKIPENSSWLREALNKTYIGAPLHAKQFSGVFDTPKTLFLVDGFDEADEETQRGLEEAIKTHPCSFLVTSRPTVPIAFERKLQCNGFSETQREEYIASFSTLKGSEENDSKNCTKKAKRLLKALKNNVSFWYLSRCPLILQMLCQYYFKSGVETLPNTTTALYEQVVNEFLQRARIHVGGVDSLWLKKVREKIKKLEAEETELRTKETTAEMIRTWLDLIEIERKDLRKPQEKGKLVALAKLEDALNRWLREEYISEQRPKKEELENYLNTLNQGAKAAREFRDSLVTLTSDLDNALKEAADCSILHAKAYEFTKQGKIFFDLEGLAKFHLLGTGFIERAGTDQNGNELFCFTHLTFQEYFAALYLSNWTKEEQRQFVIEHRNQSRFRQVLAFFTGLLAGKENGSELVEELFAWMHSPGADIIGAYQLELLLKCLNECSDSGFKERIYRIYGLLEPTLAVALLRRDLKGLDLPSWLIRCSQEAHEASKFLVKNTLSFLLSALPSDSASPFSSGQIIRDLCQMNVLLSNRQRAQILAHLDQPVYYPYHTFYWSQFLLLRGASKQIVYQILDWTARRVISSGFIWKMVYPTLDKSTKTLVDEYVRSHPDHLFLKTSSDAVLDWQTWLESSEISTEALEDLLENKISPTIIREALMGIKLDAKRLIRMREIVEKAWTREASAGIAWTILDALVEFTPKELFDHLPKPKELFAQIEKTGFTQMVTFTFMTFTEYAPPRYFPPLISELIGYLKKSNLPPESRLQTYQSLAVISRKAPSEELEQVAAGLKSRYPDDALGTRDGLIAKWFYHAAANTVERISDSSLPEFKEMANTILSDDTSARDFDSVAHFLSALTLRDPSIFPQVIAFVQRSQKHLSGIDQAFFPGKVLRSLVRLGPVLAGIEDQSVKSTISAFFFPLIERQFASQNSVSVSIGESIDYTEEGVRASIYILQWTYPHLNSDQQDKALDMLLHGLLSFHEAISFRRVMPEYDKLFPFPLKKSFSNLFAQIPVGYFCDAFQRNKSDQDIKKWKTPLKLLVIHFLISKNHLTLYRDVTGFQLASVEVPLLILKEEQAKCVEEFCVSALPFKRYVTNYLSNAAADPIAQKPAETSEPPLPLSWLTNLSPTKHQPPLGIDPQTLELEPIVSDLAKRNRLCVLPNDQTGFFYQEDCLTREQLAQVISLQRDKLDLRDRKGLSEAEAWLSYAVGIESGVDPTIDRLLNRLKIAEIYLKLGKPIPAKDYLQKTTRSDIERLTYPSQIAWFELLGDTEKALGNFSAALKEYGEARDLASPARLRRYEARIGDKMAQLYLLSGKYEQARNVLEKTLQLCLYKDSLDQVYPPPAWVFWLHPSCLSSKGSLSLAEGNLIEAFDSFNQLFEICKAEPRLWSDPLLIKTVIQLGLVKEQQGDKKNSLMYMSEAYSRAWEEFGEDSPETAQCLSKMGRALSYQNWKQAQNFLNSALEQLNKWFGSAHPEVAECLADFGFCYLSQSKFAEAQKYYAESLRNLKALPTTAAEELKNRIMRFKSEIKATRSNQFMEEFINNLESQTR